MGDETTKICLNSKGRRKGIDSDLAAFLDYIEGKAPKGKFTETIANEVEVAKENKDNILFLYNDHYISHSVANSRLKRILKSTLGMEVKDISTHSLRHTFATRCIEAGMSAVVLQRLIGHTDISITLNTYTSVFNRFKESELEKVMEYYKTNSLGLEPIKNEEIVEYKKVEIEDDMEM